MSTLGVITSKDVISSAVDCDDWRTDEADEDEEGTDADDWGDMLKRVGNMGVLTEDGS